jgi:hypothetical protein
MQQKAEGHNISNFNKNWTQHKHKISCRQIYRNTKVHTLAAKPNLKPINGPFTWKIIIKDQSKSKIKTYTWGEDGSISLNFSVNPKTLKYQIWKIEY